MFAKIRALLKRKPPEPTLTVSARRGNDCDSIIKCWGSGWRPGATVELTFDGSHTPIRADNNGNFDDDSRLSAQASHSEQLRLFTVAARQETRTLAIGLLLPGRDEGQPPANPSESQPTLHLSVTRAELITRLGYSGTGWNPTRDVSIECDGHQVALPVRRDGSFGRDDPSAIVISHDRREYMPLVSAQQDGHKFQAIVFVPNATMEMPPG